MWSEDFDAFIDDAPKKRRRLNSGHRKKEQQSISFEEPKMLEDLITHSKKVAEVRGWFEYVGRSASLLLVSGPAGSAKTVTVKLVAHGLGYECREWINPTDKMEFDALDFNDMDFYDTSTYKEPKQMEKFESFIYRSSRYQTLASSRPKRFILVEDFPNYFIKNPSTFHDFLTKYQKVGQCPIVFICTDDDKLNLNYEMFPTHVKSNFQITNIKFNPISNSAMTKALQRYCPSASKSFLEDVVRVSNGDIRAALSQLQFSLGKGKYNSKTSLSSLNKDASTDFYQTIGRVLYPKRREQPSDDSKLFVHDVCEIAEHFTDTFLIMLQENFLSTFSNLNDAVIACSVLSESDVFMSAGDMLKTYAGLISVIGVMNANKQVKKGTFKPLGRSRWFGVVKQMKDESQRQYPEFLLTNRNLNLDVIPYLKKFPMYQSRISNTDSDRFRSISDNSGCSQRNFFKAPPPPPALKSSDSDGDDDNDDMVIEEFED